MKTALTDKAKKTLEHKVSSLLENKKTDVKKLTELGKKGVLAMVCDSTNIFNLGSSGSERLVRTGLLTVLEKMKNRIVITSFASNVARMETVFKVAEKIGRHVCLVGRSMNRIYELARQCNYLQEIKGKKTFFFLFI